MILHAPKNGFFYIINRSNGKLLSAEKYVKADWASSIDMKTGRPIEREGARYEDGEELVWPSAFGGHNWHAMSYNPNTGLVYIPSIEMPGLFSDNHIDIQAWKSPYWKFDPAIAFGDERIGGDAGTGALRAWDPLRQKLVWEVPLPGVWNPGTMTTAGNLLFQGRADGTFYAYEAKTGKVLWKTDLGSGISAPPITYSVDGRQYVSLLVGWGGAGAATPGFLGGRHGWAYKAHPRRLVTFALDAKVELPPAPPPVFPQPLVAPDFELDAEKVKTGTRLYVEYCVMCHGAGAESGGYAPDLRAATSALDIDAFTDVVTKGVRRAMGMPDFANLAREEVVAIQHYIRSQARLE